MVAPNGAGSGVGAGVGAGNEGSGHGFNSASGSGGRNRAERSGGARPGQDSPTTVSLETKLLAAACLAVLVQTHDGSMSFTAVVVYAAALLGGVAAVAAVLDRA